MWLGIYFKCLILSIGSNLIQIQHDENHTNYLETSLFEIQETLIQQSSFKKQEIHCLGKTQKFLFSVILKNIYLFQTKHNNIVVKSANSGSRLPEFRLWLCHLLAMCLDLTRHVPQFCHE